MPRYEYRCPNGHKTETRTRLPAPLDEVKCLTCGAWAKRVWSAFTFMMK